MEAGGDSFIVELLWEGSGAGVLSWIRGCGCMRGLGGGCSWECLGGIRGRCPSRKWGVEECSQPGFQIPQGTEMPCGAGTEGLAALGNPLHLSRGKPPATRDLAGAQEPSRHTRSSFPAQSPLNHGRSGPGPVGLSQSPACDTNSCVTPTSSPPLWEL